MTLKIKHLKVKTSTDWLAYQRWLPVALRAKAEQLGIPSKYLVPLKLTKAAPVSQISKAIDDCNQRFDDLCRFIRNSDASDVSKAEAGKAAKGFLEARGIPQGSLANVDVMDPEFDGILSDALGIHENQHHQNWDKVYPEAKRMPDALVSAVKDLLETPVGHEKYHLFSDAIDRYKEAKEREKRQNSQTDTQLNRQLRMLEKEFRRLDDFVAFTGNKEFTSDNCNVSLRLYKDELMRHYDKPETARRALTPCAAAFRMFADEVATNVAITKVTIKGQTAASKVRPVLDIETELPLVWAAAHDDSYDHFFRLAVFGIFSGSHASELVQTDVHKVYPKKGYYISGGTKTTARLRPVIIVNDTHRELLLKFSEGAAKGFTSVCGFRAEQTESRHSKLLKEQLTKATGNPELIPYSLRHTGKHLGEIKGVSNLETFQRMLGWTSGGSKVKDDYGRAGVFSTSMINSYREITHKLLEGLPDHERPTPAASTAKVVKLHKR